MISRNKFKIVSRKDKITIFLVIPTIIFHNYVLKTRFCITNNQKMILNLFKCSFRKGFHTDLTCHLNLICCNSWYVFAKKDNATINDKGYRNEENLAYLCNFNESRTIGNNISMCEHRSLWISCRDKTSDTFILQMGVLKDAKTCQQTNGKIWQKEECSELCAKVLPEALFVHSVVFSFIKMHITPMFFSTEINRCYNRLNI